MKTKILILLLLSTSLMYAQYSQYYNINSNLNANVYEYKTISTIDYGALRLANVQAEKNRFERQKYVDEQQKQIAFEISQDPLKSFEYGSRFSTALTRDIKLNAAMVKILKNRGFKKAKITFMAPSELLFSTLSSSHQPFFSFQNVSSDNIKTDLHMDIPTATPKDFKFSIEKKFDRIIVGKETEHVDDKAGAKNQKILYHKKELNRATIYGEKGYRETVIWEDFFEFGITDTYIYNAEDFGYFIAVEVRYYGNKSETDFEKLEGRRFFLKPLMEKIISTATIDEIKLTK